MTDWLHYIMGPLVGAFIGWLTNGIAIKMLFKPLKPKYIGKWKLPFTPGIIPKERDRLARSIGTVAETLVDERALRRTLLSDEMLERIRIAAADFITRQSANRSTLRSVIAGWTSDEVVDSIVEKGSSKLADVVYERVSDSEFCRGVTLSIIDHIQERMRSVGALGRVLAAMGDVTRGAISTVVAKSVTPILRSSSRDIVYRMASGELNTLLDKPVADIVGMSGASPDQTAARIVEIYRKAVASQLPTVLREINIAGIVERSISEMDIAEVEEMLMRVMNKELRAIILLGALLGFIMGIVNSFF